MVTTFLISQNFEESARCLDPKRLGKQRVEAYQILNILTDALYLSWYYQITPPGIQASQETIYQWIRDLRGRLQNLPVRLVWNQTNQFLEVFSLDSGKPNFHPEKWSLDQKIPVGYRQVGVGMRNHPIVCRWYGYLPALAEYINAHIRVWIQRGYRNTMKFYRLPSKISYPAWVFNPEFHRQMKARLRQKEQVAWQEYCQGTRRHPPICWYEKQLLFLEAGSEF